MPGPSIRTRLFHRRCAPVAAFLGRHPRLAGGAVACVLAASIAALFLAAALQLRVQQIEEGHGQILDRMKRVMADTRALFDALDALDVWQAPACDPRALDAIRATMFDHRYARAVGVLDARGRTVCTTVLGVLPQPLPPGRGGIDGSVGRYYLATPLRPFAGPAAGQAVGTVIERGRFQVLVDNRPTSDAFAEHADAVWAGGGAQNRRVYAGPGADRPDTPIGPATPRLQFDARHCRLRVTTVLPGVSPIAVQSVIRLDSIRGGGRPALAVVLLLCVLFGWLARNGMVRRFRHFRSMDYRIEHLCTPSNLVCHYQPILELESGRVIGCEVLARLRDGDDLLAPDKFIPSLNRRGLSWRLDEAASRAGLSELAAALPPQTGGRFMVALNFFPQNLQHAQIHRHLRAVAAALGRTDLQVELEVTEYDFSPDLAPELQRLKADGYGISIDDFGTGYSNLGMVRKVSPDHLKIDRSFVSDMEDDTVRSSLIPEIIAIARAVGSEVIAEGIETAAQESRLRQLGVRYGQGYRYARPMPIGPLVEYIRSKSAITNRPPQESAPSPSE